MARTLYRLGTNAQYMGTLSGSEEFLREALAVYRRLDSPRGIANTLSMLGYSLIFQERESEAQPLLQESHTLFHEIGERSGLARSLRDQAGLRHRMGRPAEAIALSEQSRTAYEELGDRRNVIEVTFSLLEQKLSAGKYDEVYDEATAALAEAQENEFQWAAGIFLHLLGQVAFVNGSLQEAQARLQASVQAFADGGQDRFHCDVHAFLALVARAQGEPMRAQQKVIQALTIGIHNGVARSVLRTLPVAALLMADQGDVPQALALHEFVLSNDQMANDQWWRDVAFNELDSLAGQLSADERELAPAIQDPDLFAVAAALLAEFQGVTRE